MKEKGSFIIFLKGFLMGMADIIPGISGGTVALITGIYERLVRSISEVNFDFAGSILKGDIAGAKEDIKKIDTELFLPLGTGIALAFLLMANVISFLLEDFTAITYALFLGLILASALLLQVKKEGKTRTTDVLSTVLGFAFAFLLIGSDTLNMGHSLPIIFLSGMAAICAMILPGISGAFILLFLGQYEYMLHALKGLQFVEIITFCAGATVSILIFSRVLNYALKKHHNVIVSFLIGLMIGALRLPYQEISSDMTVGAMLPIILTVIAGFSIVAILEAKFGKRKTKKE